MKVLAAVCGVMIVLLGVWSTGRYPGEAQSAVEIVCLVGGLILCFLAVVLGRLDALAARLDAPGGPVQAAPAPAPMQAAPRSADRSPVPKRAVP